MPIKGEFVSDESLRLKECFANLASDNISIEELKAISRKTAVPLRRVECFALDKGLIPLRYQRNIGTVGVSGQIGLLESTVMLVGLGGLGGTFLSKLPGRASAQLLELIRTYSTKAILTVSCFPPRILLAKKKLPLLKNVSAK